MLDARITAVEITRRRTLVRGEVCCTSSRAMEVGPQTQAFWKGFPPKGSGGDYSRAV